MDGGKFGFFRQVENVDERVITLPFPLVESSLKLFDRCFLAPTQPSGERLRYGFKVALRDDDDDFGQFLMTLVIL